MRPRDSPVPLNGIDAIEFMGPEATEFMGLEATEVMGPEATEATRQPHDPTALCPDEAMTRQTQRLHFSTVSEVCVATTSNNLSSDQAASPESDDLSSARLGETKTQRLHFRF